MKATFALLADTEINNQVRKLVWGVHCRYGINIDVCRLPPHISLKQPFAAPDLAVLEGYMNELVRSIRPFEVSLRQLQLIPATIDNLETAILWLDVDEAPLLRQLHERLNRELAARFANTQARHDGAGYHFHMTVAMGGQPWATYKRVYEEMAAAGANLHFTARELALFVYDEDANLCSRYMTYKVLPLSATPLLP